MALTDANGGLSAADIAAVTGGGNNGFGFGGDGAWWLLVLFLFAFGGNGWGGYGGGNGFNTYAVDSGVQRGFDQSAVMAGLNTIQSQMCTNEMARLQSDGNLTQAIADLKYTVATEACADRSAVTTGVRDILENQNRGTQMILDKLCQQEIDALKAQNAELQTQLNMQNLAASQANQTAQLIADNNAQTVALIQRIAPYPVPSYNVANPYVNNGCGCYSNSCGCNTI